VVPATDYPIHEQAPPRQTRSATTEHMGTRPLALYPAERPQRQPPRGIWSRETASHRHRGTRESRTPPIPQHRDRCPDAKGHRASSAGHRAPACSRRHAPRFPPWSPMIPGPSSRSHRLIRAPTRHADRSGPRERSGRRGGAETAAPPLEQTPGRRPSHRSVGQAAVVRNRAVSASGLSPHRPRDRRCCFSSSPAWSRS
jgi:hypothetical protein